MSGVKINNIVKRSISLSPLVNQWAEELAAQRGFGTNFSAFCADLIRRAQDQESAPAAKQPAPKFMPERPVAEVFKKLKPGKNPAKAKAANG